MRCEGCRGDTLCVEGDGPPSSIMLIGEAPGADEERVGKPFCGQAGRELSQTYLRRAGLERGELYVTNMVKCRPPQNRTPKPAESQVCSQYWLPGELAECRPEVVVLLGATACRLLGDGFDLETEHGIPRKASFMGWEGWVVPINHPAAGLHDTGMMQPMLEDWERLGPWLREDVWGWAVEDKRERDYRLVGLPSDLRRYFSACGNQERWCAIDTESHGQASWSVQVSIQPGTARMFLLDGMLGMGAAKELGRLLRGWTVVYHNAVADLPVMRSLEVGIEQLPFKDTMQEAYGFQNMRQGLKWLSRRLLGRVRPGWYEVVRPPSQLVLEGWLCQAFSYVEKEWVHVEQRVGKRGQAIKPLVKKHQVQTALESIINHTRDGEDYDPWMKLRERVGKEELRQLEAVLGPVPILGIANCRIEDAVEYGCSDADDTLAIALLFKEMRGKVGVEVVEEDIDG